MRYALFAVLVLLVATLMACVDTPAPSYANPPLVTSSALQAAVEARQIQAYENAIRAEQDMQHAQSTLAAAYAQQTATAVAQEQEYARATMTADAHRATATAEAHATATAWAIAQSNATATAMADRATATAEVHATHNAWTATAVVAQAQATEAAATQTAVVEATREAERAAVAQEQIKREQLETRRQQLVHPLKAYGPWAILVTFVVLLAWGGYRLLRAWEMRVRAVPRDARGDAPIMILQQGGHIVQHDPDRSFNPVTVINPQGQVTQPRLADTEDQERTTARDQAVDLSSRGLPRPSAKKKQGVKRKAGRLLQRSSRPVRPPAGKVQVIPPRRVETWLADVRPQAWKHALTVDGEVLDE